MSAERRDNSPTLRAEDVGRILEISRRMGSERDLDPLLELVLAETSALLGAERASLFLYDAAKDELYSKIAQDSEIGEIRFPAGAGIAGHVAQHKVCLNISDAYNDPRFNPEPDRRTGFRTRNILACAMLDLDGNLVGVLEVLNKRGGTFGAYDEYVLAVVAAQAGVALDRARLQAQYRAKVAMERELEVARTIQQALLPRELPCVEGFDVSGWSEPAAQTGGDIYDVFPLSSGPQGKSNCLGFLLGDATGHGLGPALMISEARAAIRALAASTSDLGLILVEVNRLLVNDSTDGRFVTLFAGLIDGPARRVWYSSAGQGPAFVMRAGGRRVDTLEPTGMPLGILPGPNWPARLLDMAPGDLLIVVSDGIVECTDPQGGVFGSAALLEAARRVRDRSASDVVAEIAGQSTDFIAGRPPADDRTVVVVKRNE